MSKSTPTRRGPDNNGSEDRYSSCIRCHTEPLCTALLEDEPVCIACIPHVVGQGLERCKVEAGQWKLDECENLWTCVDCTQQFPYSYHLPLTTAACSDGRCLALASAAGCDESIHQTRCIPCTEAFHQGHAKMRCKSCKRSGSGSNCRICIECDGPLCPSCVNVVPLGGFGLGWVSNPSKVCKCLSDPAAVRWLIREAKGKHHPQSSDNEAIYCNPCLERLHMVACGRCNTMIRGACVWASLFDHDPAQPSFKWIVHADYYYNPSASTDATASAAAASVLGAATTTTTTTTRRMA